MVAGVFIVGGQLDKFSITIDHYWPKNRGGSDDYKNLRPACSKCNGAKSNKRPEDFIFELNCKNKLAWNDTRKKK